MLPALSLNMRAISQPLPPHPLICCWNRDESFARSNFLFFFLLFCAKLAFAFWLIPPASNLFLFSPQKALCKLQEKTNVKQTISSCPVSQESSPVSHPPTPHTKQPKGQSFQPGLHKANAWLGVAWQGESRPWQHTAFLSLHFTHLTASVDHPPALWEADVALLLLRKQRQVILHKAAHGCHHFASFRSPVREIICYKPPSFSPQAMIIRTGASNMASVPLLVWWSTGLLYHPPTCPKATLALLLSR